MNNELPAIRRGEIWRVAGCDAGSREARHVLVISSDSLSRLSFRTVMPVTHCRYQGSEAPWKIRIEPHERNGLEDVSLVDARKVGALPVRSFIDRIGAVSPEELEDIAEAVAIVIECW